MEPTVNKGGRPRGFDRDHAVGTAMLIFRRHGYEGVSLAMLTKAIGVAPPSLYAAFGSKADLYREAIDRYAASTVLTLLCDDEPAFTLTEALERMFERAILSVVEPSGERGCMISTALLGCHPDHQALAQDMAARRAALKSRLADELARWLPPDRSRELAAFLCAVLQGIAVQARDGASIDDLRMMAVTARSCVVR